MKLRHLTASTTPIRALDRIESWLLRTTFGSKGDLSLYTDKMSHVSPVFTDYEQQVVRELALHRVQPNAVQRVLEGAGKPMAKLMNFGRNSQSRAVRGIADHVHGWIEEGLIKTFRAANRLANTKDISKRYAARGIRIGEDFESLRFMPLSQLDAVADSFRWGSTLLLGAEGVLLGGATTMARFHGGDCRCPHPTSGSRRRLD